MNSLGQVVSYLLEADAVIIVTHERPDADALGSCLGLARALRKCDKRVQVVVKDAIPQNLRFLPEIDLMSPSIADYRFDVAVALDAGEPAQIESGLYDELMRQGIPFIVVDHHKSNMGYGKANLIVPTKSSTAELVLRVIEQLGIPLDETIATNLLAGIIFDTRVFTTPNTTAATLEAASVLIREGGAFLDVINHHRDQYSFKSLKLWGYALANGQMRDGIAWVMISRDMYESTDTTMEHTEGLVNFILNAYDVQISLVIRERPDGGAIRVSGRSKPGVDLLPLAQSYPGGGGHSGAVGFDIDAPLQQAVELVIAHALDLLESGSLKSKQ
jgi:phosphoesterase RecJ-like protein